MWWRGCSRGTFSPAGLDLCSVLLAVQGHNVKALPGCLTTQQELTLTSSPTSVTSKLGDSWELTVELLLA